MIGSPQKLFVLASRGAFAGGVVGEVLKIRFHRGYFFGTPAFYLHMPLDIVVGLAGIIGWVAPHQTRLDHLLKQARKISQASATTPLSLSTRSVWQMCSLPRLLSELAPQPFSFRSARK